MTNRRWMVTSISSDLNTIWIGSPHKQIMTPKKLTIGNWNLKIHPWKRRNNRNIYKNHKSWVPAIGLNWVFTTDFPKSRVARAQTWPLPEPNPNQRSFAVAPATMNMRAKYGSWPWENEHLLPNLGGTSPSIKNRWCSSKSCCVLTTKMLPKNFKLCCA